MTLAFLADVPDRHLDELVERLGRAAARRVRRSRPGSPAAGPSPTPRAPGCCGPGSTSTSHGRTELARAATGARAAATRTGIAVAGQRFRPHVTVARLGRPTDVSDWVRLLDAYAGPTWRATELTLVASYLGEGPPDARATRPSTRSRSERPRDVRPRGSRGLGSHP